MPVNDYESDEEEQVGLIAESNVNRIANPFEIDDFPLPTHHRDRESANRNRPQNNQQYNHNKRRVRTSYRERLVRDSCYFLLCMVFIGLGALWSMELGDPSDSSSSDSRYHGEGSSEDYSQFSVHEREVSPVTSPPTSHPTVDDRFIKSISIIGERNSGTAWLRDHLNGCFPRIKVETSLHRDSHWFQTDPSSVKEDTLVIPIFLNIFDWVETMRLEPHNMPEHMNLDWFSFVTKPWTMPRPERDTSLTNKDGEICQLGFRYNEVISCIEGTVPAAYRTNRVLRTQFLPVYELKVDGSGIPYENIVKLRNDKIINHLSVESWEHVKGVIPTQYETLVNTGLSPLLDKIEELTGMLPVCERNAKAKPIGGLETLDEGLIHWLNDNADWSVESKVGYEFNLRPYTPLVSRTVAPNGSNVIERIALIGERNTGSRWLTKKLRECYPELKTTPSLHRWKHWFQEDSSQVHENTMVVTISINPYDWVEAMMRVPHNMPAHMMGDWYEFLTRPWTIERPERDLVLSGETGNVCQHDFRYDQVISCIPGSPPKGQRSLRSEYQPIYELKLDSPGEAYSNILEFRSAKKANFLTVKDWDKVKAFVSVQYEELVNNGPIKMIEEIEKITGLKASCDTSTRAPIIGGSDLLNSTMLDYISLHTDWDVEEKYGYVKGSRPYSILSTNGVTKNEDASKEKSTPSPSNVPSVEGNVTHVSSQKPTYSLNKPSQFPTEVVGVNGSN